MTALIDRPDLNQRDARKTISKSFLQQVGYCGQKAWYSLHDPRPFIPVERVTFGSCVDAVVELAIKALRSGQPVPLNRCKEAAAWVAERDSMDIDLDAVVLAAERFEFEVAPHIDLSRAETQHHIKLDIPGLGEFDGHPDILTPGEVWDVKATEKAKPQDAAATSYDELGIYAVAREIETGHPVNKVGYLSWVRSKKPYWQIVSAPVTPAMRRISLARASNVVRALEADSMLNDGAASPVNGSFPTGPKWPSMCSDCAWNPALGGPCAMAGEGLEAAA